MIKTSIKKRVYIFKKTPKNAFGFSLIECIMYIAILSLLGVIMFESVSAVQHRITHSNKRRHTLLEWHGALTLLARDMQTLPAQKRDIVVRTSGSLFTEIIWKTALYKQTAAPAIAIDSPTSASHIIHSQNPSAHKASWPSLGWSLHDGRLERNEGVFNYQSQRWEKRTGSLVATGLKEYTITLLDHPTLLNHIRGTLITMTGEALALEAPYTLKQQVAIRLSEGVAA